VSALDINLLTASRMEALPDSPLIAVDLEEEARAVHCCLHQAERFLTMAQLGGSPAIR